MLNKTLLAIAITSSLTVTAFAAEKYQKYNFTNQPSVAMKSGKVKLEDLAQKPTTWLIKLNTPSLSERSLNGFLTPSASTQATIGINKTQQDVIAAVNALSKDIEVVAQTKNLVSGIIVKGNPSLLKELLNNPSVKDILPIYDYELNVEESAEYMKGTSLVTSGVATGEGIRVAVLDTGVDYTHKAMGGAGTVEAYAQATADLTDTPVWPQGNVIGGYDFVNGDPDPIDFDTNHGTHVSHSVLGLAPDAELYVYSVCERSCSGIAQLMALEAAMDPNGDGDIADRVDVINMSLGGTFGSTSRVGAVEELLNKAAMLGVSVAISAGNDGATPFIVGGPSTTKNVMSVGAMTHPTVESPAYVFNDKVMLTASAGFGPKALVFTDENTSLVYPETNQNGCVAFDEALDFTDKIVLIDRGTCSFTSKVINAQNRGAKSVIIANNVAGEGALGPAGTDDAVAIPSVGISMEDGQVIKDALANGTPYTLSSDNIAMPGAIASFTSRGPSSDGWLKPEITAPGVDIMTASPGTGDGETPISGTSFSSPMTAGAMALLREALPNRTSLEIKATLMNSANLDITLVPRSIDPKAALAPISFIGAGLVDVEKASKLPVAAWDKNTKQAALAYGLMNLSATEEVTKTVTIKNFTSSAKNYSLSLDERFADDTATGAISFSYPASVTVPAGGSIDIDVSLTVDPAKLHEWTLTSDKLASPSGSDDLTTLEFDGALIFTDGDDNFHLVYHLLPKASASVEVNATISDEGVKRFITNTGVKDLAVFAVPLTAEDEVGDSPYLDMQAASIEVLDVPVENCASGYAVFTTFTMAEGFTSTTQGGLYADFDLNSDGIFDYSAQTVNYSVFGDFPAGAIVSFTSAWGSYRGGVGDVFFTSGNNFVTIQSCIEDVGLSATDLGSVDATVRFRTSSSLLDFYNRFGAPLDVATATGVDFSLSNEAVRLIDDEREEVEILAVGETARLLTSGQDFVMLSDSGSHPLIAKPTQEEGVAPVVTPDQSFSVDENTADGTIIGNVIATDPDLYTSPVAEYFIQSSSSVAVMMERDGTIKVADSTLLDYDAGLTVITLEVNAIDSVGNVSDAVLVTVNVNNLKDEASEQPKPVEVATKKSSSGGSTGWMSLLLIPALLLRRKKK
jgi:minor extracellular serine protease Vpr